MDETNTLSNVPSHFGKMLQDARIAKGLTIEQVSDELKIMKRHILALEAEDYEALPPGAFSRGFLTNYARFLGLNSTEVTNIFDAHYPEHLKPKAATQIRAPLQPMGTLNRESRGRIKLNPWLIGGVILALGIGIFIIKSINKARTETQTQVATKAPSKTESIAPQDRMNGAALANTGSAVTSTSSVIASGTALPSAGSAIGTVAASSSQLEVLVKDSTPITITDATGKALLQGEQTKGNYKVSGQPPFNVVIENIKNVNLDMNKQPIKLSDYTTTNQANFTLK